MEWLAGEKSIMSVQTQHITRQDHLWNHACLWKNTVPLESLAKSLQRVQHTATFGAGNVWNQHTSINCAQKKEYNHSFTPSLGKLSEIQVTTSHNQFLNFPFRLAIWPCESCEYVAWTHPTQHFSKTLSYQAPTCSVELVGMRLFRVPMRSSSMSVW